MERLNFSLPEFSRLSWVSDEARHVWQPRLTRILKAWQEIEWMSVARGVRRCCIAVASPELFLQQAGVWSQHGLCALPLEMQGVSGCYTNGTTKLEAGKPFVFRFALGTVDDVAEFKRAFDAADDSAIGAMLGYPPCCHDFFRRVWVEERMIDTTWPMALETVAAHNQSTQAEDDTTLEVEGAPEANILWRWMGVRAVPHLPCRCDCKESVELGRTLMALGRALEYSDEMDWMLEILSWPVEWSALHGIAEIKTPILKVSACSDATARKYTVRRNGTTYPDEGVQGLNFPFRVPQTMRLSDSKSYLRGLENPIQIINNLN